MLVYMTLRALDSLRPLRTSPASQGNDPTPPHGPHNQGSQPTVTAGSTTTAFAYLAVALLLILGAPLLRNLQGHAPPYLHSLLECASTLLALMIGALALLRHWSRRTDSLFFIGLGFLGTALLDGFHTLTTLPDLTILPTALQGPSIPWTWFVSRMFLSSMLLGSWLVWYREDRGEADRRSFERALWITAAGFVLGCILSFSTFPVPGGYFQLPVFGRPQELIPGALFALAFVGYLQRGRWKTSVYERWLVLSLILETIGQLQYMSTSEHLHDAMFIANHALKGAAYGCVLIGLMGNSYQLFRRAEDDCQAALRAEDAVRVSHLLLEHQVAQRTAELAATVQSLKWEIAERQAVEAELRRSHRLLSGALDGIAELDAEGRYLTVNEAYARLLGYTPSDLVGQPWCATVPEREYATVQQAMAQLPEGAKVTLEFQGLHRDGTASLQEVVMLRPAHRSSEVTACVWFVRDLEDRRRMEAQLRHAQKLQLIGQLTTGVAHDFNNVLTIVLGYAQIGLDQSARQPSPGSLRGMLEEIEHAGQRAACLTRQLLAFGRKQTVHRTALDLNGLVAGMQRLLERALGENIVLRTNLAREVPRIHADASQIEQMLLNLVVNARDAIGAEGHVHIETDVCNRDEWVRAGASGDVPEAVVRLTVSDTGQGMDEATQGRMFEPFFTTKEKGKGTGLGLSTVRDIVTQHEGRIVVDSRPGGGTRFEILLPALCGEEPPARDPSVPAPAMAAARTAPQILLLVEDEDSIRHLAAFILRSQGYEVLEAPHGQAAIETAQAHPGSLDLIVTDINLPGVSGPALAGHMRGCRPGIPILFTSGSLEGFPPEHEAKDERTAFLAKPFTAMALIQKVRELLDGPRR